MDKSQIITHIEQPINFTPYDVKWIPYSAKVVALGCTHKATGLINVYEINGPKLKLIKEIVKSKALKCATFGASSIADRPIATGDLHGQLDIWDLENAESPIYSVKAHESIINSIDGIGGLKRGFGSPELVTGSRDGSVKLWDPRQKGSSVASMEPADQSNSVDCWTVTFGNSFDNDNRCICAGYDNGDVKMFDLRTNSASWEHNVKNGVCGIEFNRKDIEMDKMIATTLDSKFHLFNMRSKTSNKEFLTETAHKSTIWTVRHTPQNRDVFVTAGGSGTLNLWKYSCNSDKEKLGTIDLIQSATVANQPIPAFDWSPDKQGLAACISFDQCLRILVVTKLNLL